MHLVTSLFLLLASAHLLGWLSVQCRQPAMLGHILAGIVLGPSLLAQIAPTTALATLADVAVLFVVLTAGLEIRLQSVLDTYRGRGAAAMLLGFALPATAGIAVATVFSVAIVPTLVIALCIAVTALPITLQILRSFGMLQTRVGHVAIAVALLSDVLVLMLLGILIEVTVSQQLQNAATATLFAVGKLLFLVVALVTAQWLSQRIMQRRSNNALASNVTTNLSLAMMFVLALGALSEVLGLHFVIGAFFAAMMITPELIGENTFERLGSTCEVLTASLFGPLFLAYQGLQLQIQTLSHPSLVIALIIAAITAKLLSGYWIGRLQKMSSHAAWGVGIVMNAHGVMEFVIASIAFHAGLIDATLFSTLLIVGMITTVLTPPLLRRWQAAAPLTEQAATANAP